MNFIPQSGFIEAAKQLSTWLPGCKDRCLVKRLFVFEAKPKFFCLHKTHLINLPLLLHKKAPYKTVMKKTLYCESQKYVRCTYHKNAV